MSLDTKELIKLLEEIDSEIQSVYEKIPVLSDGGTKEDDKNIDCLGYAMDYIWGAIKQLEKYKK